jgi:hypothetical protein
LTASLTLTPVEAIVTGVPLRKLHRWCREGRIHGAEKIGRRWFVRTGPKPIDDELVRAQLRELGFAA